ncbi:MAG TPA: right-handed parallel beta-helix repeat-containing protein [Solirubrobacterales bacterium]|nr:right-handed parallel beta-helix repeat-containing protein [Solirubrobacterales bacterium]
MAVLACAFAALLAPAAASAVYFVDSTGDQPDETLDGTCKTAVNTCTLRAAIQESNNSTSVIDSIEFNSSFNGELANDTITAASDLPTITDQVNIRGGICFSEAGVGINGPCVGVVRSGGGSLFVVDDDNVEIEGIAITGATNGINVINESDGFIAKSDWVGLNLKGEAVGNNTGILLGPGADEAQIGGSSETEEEGNVIGGNAAVGLDLEGASKAKILGNYFGVAPNGTTLRSNPKDIEITNSVTIAKEAKENEIGQAISLAKRLTTKCDGGCNVIAGAVTKGVDLQGDGEFLNELPASGPTLIRGNYVGLGANGETVVQNSEYGILAGAADNVQVGGLAEGETNNFAGGLFGVYGENGDNLDVLANVMGRDRSGAATTPPSAAGIFNISNGVTVPARLAYNSMEMSGGIGIDQRFTGAEITNNDVWGGAETGIQIKSSSVGEGNLIEGNRIREVTRVGILLEGDGNEVFGNEVFESAEAGVVVKYAGTAFPLVSPTTGNVIGGDEEGLENEIVSNGGPAILIADFEETNNEVGRNNGSANSGPFIELFNPGFFPENGPNEGIEPPSLTAAKQAGASGTAQPEAKIRVFRKASAEAGELESFLAETVADGSGNWSVTYPASIPVGTIVAATQTNVEGGTSELATATTATESSGGGGGGGGGGGQPCPAGSPGCGNNPQPIVLPDTKITKAPPKKSHKTTAKFKFTSSLAGSSFECKLDKGKFKKCRSPKTYKKLKPGNHVFKVRAVKGGKADPTPAKRKFTILP